MTILFAALAMLCQDVMLTFKSLCANRSKPMLAGLFDMLGGFCVIATVGVGIGAVHNQGLSWYTAAVFAAMGAADFIGAGIGTHLGNKWIHEDNL